MGTSTKIRRISKGLLIAASLAVVGFTTVGSPAQSLRGKDAGVAIVGAADGAGYALISAAGGQYNFGTSVFSGSLAGSSLAAPITDAVAAPNTSGTWMLGEDGGVFAHKAPSFGSMGGRHLNAPMRAIVPSATGQGYLLVAEDGGTFAFGDYPSPGSLLDQHLNSPIVDAAAAPGGGVFLVGADGGVFAMGGAKFVGGMGGKALNAPMVGIVSSSTGKGYLLVAKDGGTFAFGDFTSPGSLGGTKLSAPIVDVAVAPNNGAWLLGADGGVFELRAGFYGNAVGEGNSSDDTSMQAPTIPVNAGGWTLPTPGTRVTSWFGPRSVPGGSK